MMSYCQRCGREAGLQSGPDGGLYCMDCMSRARADCEACESCARSSGGIMACPFCERCPSAAAQAFLSQAERPSAQPTRMEEKCERCGGRMDRAFVLHGKALCKDCLYHEQDRWEIVTAKPGKTGTRVKVVVEKRKPPEPETTTKPETEDLGSETDDALGRKLIQSIGIDPENPPPDPFAKAGTMSERKMADDSCIHCEAYEQGKMRKRFLGASKPGEKK